MALLSDVFERAWVTNNGPVVNEFERRLCAVTRTRHCIPVCNATTGLMVALRALDVRGRVAVPAFTFPATVHAVEWLGLEPLLVDVDPATHAIDVASIAETEGDIGAVIGVHLWGRPGPVEAVEAFAAARGIPAIFDAAPAFGAALGDRPVGGFGRCEVFSFHATKIVSAFEGGAIATDDDELAARVRGMINFGFAGRDRVEALGINAKLSEIHAAMGIASLGLLERSIARNRRNLRDYRRRLAGLPGLRFVTGTADRSRRGNDHYVTVEVDAELTGVSRDELLAALAADGIDARRYFFPGCHRMEPYISRYPQFTESLPFTDRAAARVLQLPTGAGVSPAEIARICCVVEAALARGLPHAANG